MTELAEVHGTTRIQVDLTTRESPRKDLFWIGVAFALLLAAILVIVSAQARMGVNTDGTAYYGVSRRVMAGDGPRWAYGSRDKDLGLSVHFPPLFGLTVGHLSALLGIRDPHVTVAYFHGALLAGCVLLTAAMVRRYTGSGWIAVGSGLFVLLTADVLDTFASFMSEPLFIFLVLAGLVAVDSGARLGRRRWLGPLALVFLGGALIGAACWVRYATVAFIAAAGLGLLFYPGLTWRRRLVFAAAGGAPMLLGWWALSQYVFSITHATTSRQIRFQPDEMVYLDGMVKYPFPWFLPLSLNWYVMTTTVCGVCLALVLLFRGLERRWGAGARLPVESSATPRAGALPWVFIAAAVIYPGLMIFSAVCVDPPATPLEPRLLVPWLPFLVIVGTWLLQRRMDVSARPAFALAGLAVFLAAIGVGNSPRLMDRLRGDDEYRVGYTATGWKESEIARWVRENVPADAELFCNRCDALYYLADRNSIWVPKSHTRTDPRMRAEFAAEVDQMCKDMAKNNGYLVCFNDTWAEAFGTASPQQIMDAVREGTLVPAAVTNDGVVYRWVATPEDMPKP